MYGAATESQVGHGHSSRFLGIVDEIALGVVGGLLANDLDRVLIGADGAIRSQSPKHSAQPIARLGLKVGIIIEACKGHIVYDADSEMRLWVGSVHFVEYRLYHARGELL